MHKQINCGGKILDLRRPQVMGILNVTPDSFSDGGQFVKPEKALEQARQMVRDGAAIIDVGGESTRPGAKAVSLNQELDRVIPIIEAISNELDTIISIDTSKADVMQEAHKAGAGLINDVRALQEENALQVAYQTGLPVCLMHMQGMPRSMQNNPIYENVCEEVTLFLQDRMEACIKKGMAKSNIILDPGFGFGKTLQHNLTLLAHISELKGLGAPILIGLSRKSLLQTITNKPVKERLSGSIALAVIGALNGGTIFRVHDVDQTLDALKVVNAILEIG